MAESQKKHFLSEDGKPLHHYANEDAKDGVESLERFTEKHGTLQELAARAGREAEYEKEMKPIFDSVLGMVQIVTGGDHNRIQSLVAEPNKFFEKLIQDDAGLLRGFLMARAMHEVATRPSRRDPLEWGKFLLDIMSMSKESVVIPERVEGEVVPGRTGTTEDVLRQFLPRVDGTGRPLKG